MRELAQHATRHQSENRPKMQLDMADFTKLFEVDPKLVRRSLCEKFLYFYVVEFPKIMFGWT